MDAFDLRRWPGFSEAGGSFAEPAMIDQVAIDSQAIVSPASLFVALKGVHTDGHRFVEGSGARFALVRKDFAADRPLEKTTLLKVEDPLRAFQDIAKVYRGGLPLRMVAITGSYGKTMVKDLLQEFLKTTYRSRASPESFNSQIGVPLSLFTLSREDEIAVIEAAISEKDEMDRLASLIDPDFGIMTPIGNKHPQTLGDLTILSQEFAKLFNLGKLKWALLPHTPFLEHLKTEAFYWDHASDDLPHAAYLSGAHSLSIPFQITFPGFPAYRGEITSGFYYYLDLLNMAVKAAWKLGVGPNEICATLDRFILEPMRTEIWKSPLGVTFINDTYSQDPQSIDKAFRFVEQTAGRGRKVFFFGGLRGAHHPGTLRRVGRTLVNHQVDLVYLIGSHPFEPLKQTLSQEAPSSDIVEAPSYSEALEMYKLNMLPDDLVLIKGEKKEPLENLTQAFHESLCTNLCFINLAAIEHNIKTVRQKLPPQTRIMVMVKAYAYGTDDFRIAKFLKTCGVDILGVSYVDEGVALKRAGVSQSIFVLNAADYEMAKAIKWDLEVALSSEKCIILLAEEANKQNKKVKVHLHVDSGMSRFGCRPEEAVGLAKKILAYPVLQLEGIMTHFASADNPCDDAFTLAQAKTLEDAIFQLEKEGIQIPWKHAANSSAALRFCFSHFNMVRIGAAVYGLYSSKSTQKALELRCAISLLSRIAGINRCKRGDTISYGRTYRVEKEEQKIAVVPIGYFDGLHRNYSGRGHVAIRGRKAPMVGKICMDFMMVDVTDIPDASPGDPVLIFGEDDYGDYLSPEDLAESGNSIIHELITCLGPRIQRVFIYEEKLRRSHER
jgi:alanine racemase/UDP-N-acetylmuramoyl-tripeptide--D-alanyl-D-alanine ligase